MPFSVSFRPNGFLISGPVFCPFRCVTLRFPHLSLSASCFQ
jgi:hypothetical protein